METTAQDWEDFWQYFDDGSTPCGLGLLDERDFMGDSDPIIDPQPMLATGSAEPPACEQRLNYTSPTLPPASPFLRIEAALGTDPVPREGTIAEHNVNEVSVENLRSLCRQIDRMQDE